MRCGRALWGARRGVASLLSTPLGAVNGTSAEVARVGAANLRWRELGFSYVPTNGCMKVDFSGGRWGSVRFDEDQTVRLHAAASSLQYGQTCFEGLKAFAMVDGGVGLFRPMENATRMNESASRILMPTIPEEVFVETCIKAVRQNLEFVPPFGSDGSLYLRPVMFGTSPRIGVSAADEYNFIVLASSVGNYFADGLTPVAARVVDAFDRAAPRGLGNVKTAANYAADLLPSLQNKKLGFPVSLYLDPTEHKYIEEFGTANFAAITKNGKYITPTSSSILNSVTNRSVQVLAADLGLQVERRRIEIDELEEFEEVAALGTAVVLTPIHTIVHGDQIIRIGKHKANETATAGPVFSKLYKRMQEIQTGKHPDEHNWITRVV